MDELSSKVNHHELVDFTGCGQGNHTSTVLTDDSNYITVVSDIPYQSRKKTDFGSSLGKCGRHIKGSRPQHRTTFTFEVSPTGNTYNTSTGKTYSGKRGVQPSSRPKKCQSLHHAHFDIAVSKNMDLKTQTQDSFPSRTVQPFRLIHQDRSRWNKQMAGEEMGMSLRHNSYNLLNLESTYQNVHNSLAKERGPGIRKINPLSDRYDVISGLPIQNENKRIYSRTSGNRVLHRVRQRLDGDDPFG